MPNRNSVDPEAYRARLLNVLVSDDIKILMSKLGYPTFGDVLDSRYHLIKAWTFEAEAEVIKLIKQRLRGQ